MHEIQSVSAALPTKWGTFRIQGYERTVVTRHGERTETALALILGDGLASVKSSSASTARALSTAGSLAYFRRR